MPIQESLERSSIARKHEYKVARVHNQTAGAESEKTRQNAGTNPRGRRGTPFLFVNLLEYCPARIGMAKDHYLEAVAATRKILIPQSKNKKVSE